MSNSRFGLRTRTGLVSGIVEGLPAFNLILDDFPNAAAAYSLRKLRGGYTGNCIRVRRSSDNAEQNIGFDGNNNLDTASLLAFVGGDNGFVVTWYDQSGNGNNATQGTLASQPQIVSSGVVLTLNGKPSIRSGATFNFLQSVANFTYTEVYIACVFNRIARVSSIDNLWIFNGSPFNQMYSNSTIWSNFPGININTSIPISTQQKLISQNYNGSTNFLYDNSTLNTETNVSFTITNQLLQLLGYSALNYGTQGNIQEFIIYTTNKTLLRLNIENNINTYYNIY